MAMADPSAAPAEGALENGAFMEAFGELSDRRDWSGALALCRQQLKAKPDDRFILGLRETVQQFMDKAEELDAEDGELPPYLDELEDEAAAACRRAFEAMFEYLQDEEKLWTLGEQAVGIFWDPGQIAPSGPLRTRLAEMSRTLTEGLLRKLRASDPVTMGRTEWLFEALGDLWWCHELGIEPEPWLVDGCREEWARTDGSMEALVGFSLGALGAAEVSDVCDILTQTWTYERSIVGGLFGEAKPPGLEYGVREVLAQIRRLPLHEPGAAGFYDQFYTMTHVIYVLNCFNGCLPNYRADCPWLYSYLERSLAFWLREAKSEKDAQKSFGATAGWMADSVDAVAEAVDCLRGLHGEEESELVREGIAWLLTRQQSDGFFYSPGAKHEVDCYNHVHPTWTAAAAVQLKREVPGPSPRCAAWTAHARAAAREINFAEPPPTRREAAAKH